MTLNLPLVHPFHKENNFLYWSLDNGACGIASFLGFLDPNLTFTFNLLHERDLPDSLKSPPPYQEATHFLELHLAPSSCTITTSPILRFLFGRDHFCRKLRLMRYSFLHLLQNCSARNWTRHHRFRAYTSSLTKLPGGGRSVLFFIVSRWFGVKGSKLFGSFRHW